MDPRDAREAASTPGTLAHDIDDIRGQAAGFLRVLSSKIIVTNTKNGLSHSIVKIAVTPTDLVE